MNKNRKKKLNMPVRALGFVLSAAVAVSSFCVSLPERISANLGSIEANAAASNPITYEYYTVNLGNNVPASWVFVGTYLMSLKAVTPQLYQGALESKEIYEQDIAFYSSELDKGNWKNIDNADSISTILPGAETFEEEDLYPYIITVVVGDDGIPRDPLTGEALDIYNLYSVYDMENIPELAGIKEYYESGAISWKDKGAKNYLYRMLYFFFENDTLSGYRESLDIEKAVSEYNSILGEAGITAESRKKIEELWDTALTKATSAYPEEYKDLMLVMRNWPSVRDDITDRADSEEALLNKLFLEFQEEEMEEEADSVLYVTAQIDATRHAEIYYNLIENDKLFDTSQSFESGDLEELRLIKADLMAEIALLSVQLDDKNSEIYKLEQEIAKLKDKNAEYNSLIEAEDKAFAEDGIEDQKKALDEEYEKLSEDFKGIKEKYETLDSELEAIFNEGLEGSEDAETKSEIAEETEEKKTLSEEIKDKKARLENDLSQLKARKASAENRTEELAEAKEKYAELNAQIEKLEKNIDSEKAKLEEIRAEADKYTTSRFTSAFDSSKEYDPDKKRELDSKVEAQEKVLNTLLTTRAPIKELADSTQEAIDGIEEDLNLGTEIAGLEESIETDRRVLELLESGGIDRNDASVLEKLEILAANSESFEERLNNLKAKKAELDKAAPDYFGKKAVIDENRAKKDELVKKTEEHDKLKEEYKEKIGENDKEIAEKQKVLDDMKKSADKTDQMIDSMNTDVSTIGGVVSSANSGNPNGKLLDALNVQIRTLGAEKNIYNDDITRWQTQLDARLQEKSTLLIDKGTLEDYYKTGAAKEYLSDVDVIEKYYSDKIDALEKQILEIDGKKLNYCSVFEAGDERKALEDQKSLYTNTLFLAEHCKEVEAELKAKNTVLISRKAYLERVKRDLEYTEKNWLRLEIFRGINSDREIERLNNIINDLNTVIDGLTKEIEPLQADKEEVTAALKEGPGYKESTPIEVYIKTLTDKLDEIEKQINEAKKKEPDYVALDREKEAAQKNLDVLKGMKESDLDRAEKKYSKKLSDTKDQIGDLTEKYDAAVAAYDNCREKIAELNKSVSDTEALIAEAEEKKAGVSDTFVAYISADSFGPMPTLYFLRDAAAAGNPEMGRKFRYISAYTDYEFKADEELLEKIEEAINLCELSYDSYVAKSLSRGESAADYTGYILARNVAKKAADREKALPYVQMITDLRNIGNDETVHAERETLLLYGWLVPFSMADFNDKRTVSSQDEYQYYIKAATDRDNVMSAIVFVEGRLEYAYSIKESFSSQGKTDLIESHILWLEGLLKELRERAGLDDDDDDDGDLISEIEDEIDKAKSENDFVKAKKLEALLNGIIRSGDAGSDDNFGRQDGDTEVSITDPNTSGMPLPKDEIPKIIADEINNTDGYDFKADLDKYKAADGDIGALLSELEGGGVSSDKIDQIAASANGADTGDGSGGGSGSGEGSVADAGSGGSGGDTSHGGTGSDLSDLTVGDINDLISDIMDGNDDESKAAVVAFLAQASASSGNDSLFDYAKNLLDQLLRDGSTCIFRQYADDDTKEYVSLGAMDRCRRKSGFRYVKEGQEVTMSQSDGGSASYTFTIGKNSVLKNDDTTDTMDYVTVEQTDKYLRNDNAKIAYVEESYAKKYLGCEAVYIRTTDWAILVTPGVAAKIIELGKIINEMAERGEIGVTTLSGNL